MPHLRVLITVKTYPVVSERYDELVCTAGVSPGLGFVRLYPVRFRYLPYGQQYRKYQWIEVDAVRNPKDSREETYLPDSESISLVGRPIDTANGWAERRRIVLPWLSQSIERLTEQGRSLGIVKPAEVLDLKCTPVARDWSSKDRERLHQYMLFGPDRKPLQKLPYKFQYVFRCDDSNCKGTHTLMVEDWELGVFYFKMAEESQGNEPAAIAKVREKFLDVLCGPTRETYFFVGNTLAYPNSWLVLGVFWPPTTQQRPLCLTDSSH